MRSGAPAIAPILKATGHFGNKLSVYYTRFSTTNPQRNSGVPGERRLPLVAVVWSGSGFYGTVWHQLSRLAPSRNTASQVRCATRKRSACSSSSTGATASRALYLDPCELRRIEEIQAPSAPFGQLVNDRRWNADVQGQSWEKFKLADLVQVLQWGRVRDSVRQGGIPGATRLPSLGTCRPCSRPVSQ